MSNDNKCQNPGCGKKLKQLKGKRPKKYCNSTCRSNHFQKRQRAEKETQPVKDLSGKELVFHGPQEAIEMAKKKVKVSGIRKGIITIVTLPEKEYYDGPELKNITVDEAPLWQKPQPASVKITTLQQVKDLCPKYLKGLERSAWISTERKKYSI